MSHEKQAWDVPTNVQNPAADQASDLASKYRISLDRARMLIDRFGTDLTALDAAAKQLSTVKKIR